MFRLSEITNIKNKCEPHILFPLLYNEQNNDLKKIENVKEAKQLKALSNQKIQENIMTQFQLGKKKK